MKHFTLKQCALALCLGLASFLPGQSIATNAPDVSSPIGITLAEQEESGYAFASWNTHAEYTQIYKYSDGDRGQRNKDMSLWLPSDASMVYLKASLKDPSQANTITFQINGKDQAFDNGAIWITPKDCSQSGTMQDIPFGAKATAAGVYPYIVEAYVNQDDAKPVATWKATFYFLDRMPSIIVPNNICSENFKFNVRKGDLEQSAYVEVHLTQVKGYDSITFSATDFTSKENSTDIWINKTQSLADNEITGKLSTTGNNGVANCYITLRDINGDYICSASTSALYPFKPADSDLAALKKMVEQNPTCTELVDYINQQRWGQPKADGGSNIEIRWEAASPAHVTYFRIEDQKDSMKLDFSGLDAIQTLYLAGDRALAPINISHMSQLERIYLYNGTNLTYKDITLPTNFEKSGIYGNSKIYAIGTPVNDWDVEVPNKTVINFAAYIGEPVQGSTTTYSWQCNWNSTELTPIGGESTFQLIGEVGDTYFCTITNDSFPEWRIETPRMHLTKGVVVYNTDDLAGLRKLAADNPNVTELQEFIQNEAWTADNWDDWNAKVRTRWDGNDRLTGLKIYLDWNAQDSISKLDLSAFTELKHFECERWLTIDQLDLTKNTKLEFLHLFSYNLKSIDATACTKLETFSFATNNIGESESAFNRCNLTALKLSGDKLRMFRIEHAHLGTFDLGQFPNLEVLRIENCQTLVPQNLDKLTKLRTAELPSTNQFSDWIKQPQASVTELWIQKTDYEMPPADVLQRLQRLGVPNNVTHLDMDSLPNLKVLGWGDNRIRYSTIKNWRKDIEVAVVTCTSLSSSSWSGPNSYITLESPSHPGDTWTFEVGDTIDLSSEAVINGVETKFLWVNGRYGIKEESLFIPVEGKPGVFVIGEGAEENNYFRCRIMNPEFCEVSENIYYTEGWVMQTDNFHVNTTKTEPVFETKDVEALATIVSNSKNQGLIDWFNNEGWKKNGYTDLGIEFGGVQVEWSNEPTKRLTSLSLSFMFERLTSTVDVSTLDRLEYLELPFTNVSGVKLPTNPEKLKWLNLCNTKVTTLDVSAYTNLLHLNVQNSALKSCDLSKNTKLEHLQLGGTKVALDATIVYPEITYFMTPESMTSFNMNQMPKLTSFHVDSKTLKFSDIQNPRQMKNEDSEGNVINSYSYLIVSNTVYKDVSMVAKEAVLDFSKEIATGATISDLDSLITTSVSGQYQVDWKKAKLLCIDLTNDMFPGWTLHYPMSMLTEKGDVNYDEQVNVQDVTATVAHLVDFENQLYDYSLFAGDVNENDGIDAGDLVGIVNIIMDKPFTKSSELRAAYQPTVEIQMDEKNFLTMENEVPVAALYLEIAGANAETALLADAARLMQASSLKGDTLRIVAYSLDGHTIASGKHILAQLQPGMRIVKATFSDAQAALLQTTGDLLSTANETIAPEVEAKAIYNYPNPAAGQTTFCYQLAQPARSVEIQFFASNGAFVACLQGLPTAAGSQSYATTLPLSAGVYYYRLVIDGKQVTATNTLIIK